MESENYSVKKQMKQVLENLCTERLQEVVKVVIIGQRTIPHDTTDMDKLKGPVWSNLALNREE